MPRRRRTPLHRPPALPGLLVAMTLAVVVLVVLRSISDGDKRAGAFRNSEAARPPVIETTTPATPLTVTLTKDVAPDQKDVSTGPPDIAPPDTIAHAMPDMRLLSTIKDKTRVIPKGAYFHLVELCMKVNVHELEENLAVRNPPLVQIVRNPQAFRGRPIRLDGYVRRITPIDPGPNNLGVRVLYECAVFSDEHDLNPWIFVVLHVPEEMPTGDGLRERVTATGFFLKLWAYQAGDGMRFAPLLIGPRIVWHPAPSDAGFGPLEAALFILLLVLVATFGLVLWWSGRSAPGRSPEPDAKVEPPADAGAPEEFLKRLETEEEASTSSSP